MGLVAFIIRRLGGMVLVVVDVTAVSFILVHLAPGDPIRAALGLHASRG